MDDRKKKILTATGVAVATAATAGLAVAAVRRMRKKDVEGRVALSVRPADEGWEVRTAEDAVASRHGTKKEAVAAGRELARSHRPSRLTIHGMDGSVLRSHDYDPEE